MTHMPIRQQLTVKGEQQISGTTYLQNLQMYIIPPSGYIKLEELQQWCVNRLRVLKLVEQISLQNYKKSSKHCVTILIKQLEDNSLYDFVQLISIHSCKSERKKEQHLTRNDCISHFVLRSAFSFEYEKRQWFFKQEVKLFKWRLSLLDKDEIKGFINVNAFQYTAISEEEKQKLKNDLAISYCGIESIDGVKFYKTYFTNVINPVKKREIFLKNGIAYVPEMKMSWLIVSEFKKVLNESFTYSREIVSNAYGDERMTKIFSILPNCISTQCFNYDNDRIVSIRELDELSETSYPLCMRLLHEALKTNHHLTNGGRVQYCLFLKGIGLPVNDALQFWKSEFTKKINERTFEKEYRYSLRHLYGEEGKRADYEPFPCFKILNSTVGLRDNHGCPYKCMDLHVLKNALSKCGLVQPDVLSIVQLSKEGRYLEACRRYYEVTHNCIIETGFDHPNVYFTHSRKRFETVCSDTEE